MGGTTDDFCNWRTDSNRGASYLAPPRLGRRAHLAGKLFHRLVPLPRAQTRETERAGLATTPIGQDALGDVPATVPCMPILPPLTRNSSRIRPKKWAFLLKDPFFEPNSR